MQIEAAAEYALNVTPQTFRILVAICGFVIGSCIGSFLGCAIYRVPRGISLTKRRSHCGGCGHVLTPTELVPVFSFIWQRGRSRCCRMELSPAYVLAELACGIVGAIVAWMVF